jgi:general secretion pathway protein G
MRKTIIAAAIVCVLISGSGASARRYDPYATMQLQVLNLCSALELFRLDVGHFPRRNDGLISLIRPPLDARGWKGPYLRRTNGLTNPWGSRYGYNVSYGRPVIVEYTFHSHRC